MKTIFVYSGEMAQFDFGYDHPYKPERAIKTYDLCTRYGVMNRPWMTILDPRALGSKPAHPFSYTRLDSSHREGQSGRVRTGDVGIRSGDKR